MHLTYPRPALALHRATGGWFRLWLAGLLLIALLAAAFFTVFAQEGFEAADLVVGTTATTAFCGVFLYLLLLFLRLGLFLPRWVEAGFSAIEREAAARYGKPLLHACAFLAALLFIAVFFRYEIIATRPAGDSVVAYVRWDRWTAEARVEYRDMDKHPARWQAAHGYADSSLLAVAHANEAGR